MDRVSRIPRRHPIRILLCCHFGLVGQNLLYVPEHYVCMLVVPCCLSWWCWTKLHSSVRDWWFCAACLVGESGVFVSLEFWWNLGISEKSGIFADRR